VRSILSTIMNVWGGAMVFPSFSKSSFLCLQSHLVRKNFEKDGNTMLPLKRSWSWIRSSAQVNNVIPPRSKHTGGAILRGDHYCFEVSTDGMQSWNFTKNQNGTFLLSIPRERYCDIIVYVRAIDNLGQPPYTASTSYPIKNTKPRIFFDYSFGRKSTTFPAFRLYWM